jgi:hypothetical protein
MAQQGTQSAYMPVVTPPLANSQTYSYQNMQQESNPSVAPPVSQVEPPANHWKCRRCGDAYQEGSKCVICGLIKAENTWKCFGCGKKTAVAYDICSKCNASKDLGLYLVSRDVELTTTRQQWVCKCKAKNPLHIPTCSGCHKESKRVRDALEYKGNNMGTLETLGRLFS